MSRLTKASTRESWDIFSLANLCLYWSVNMNYSHLWWSWWCFILLMCWDEIAYTDLKFHPWSFLNNEVKHQWSKNPSVAQTQRPPSAPETHSSRPSLFQRGLTIIPDRKHSTALRELIFQHPEQEVQKYMHYGFKVVCVLCILQKEQCLDIKIVNIRRCLVYLISINLNSAISALEITFTCGKEKKMRGFILFISLQ